MIFKETGMAGGGDKPWFKPKSHGYGATPSSWEGWASVLGFVACVALAAWLLVAGPAMAGEGVGVAGLIAFFLVEAILVTALVIVAKRKSSGPWRWR